MPDPFKAQLRPVHPRPETHVSAPPPLNCEGEAFARDGYSVLSRADRGNRFAPNLQSMAPPVNNDLPNVAWDEEK